MTIGANVLQWLASRDTGVSSRAIVAWLERDPTLMAMARGYFDCPHDPADLGRCIRLLEIEPSYRARLLEMSLISKEWARIVVHWDELEALYREEYPSGRAPKCYEMMFKLVHPELAVAK